MMSLLSPLTAAVAARKMDALRVAVQTMAAAAATFLIMSWSGLPHMSWAVISALFTIQVSADSAIRTALGRLAGSFLGVGLGLLAVALISGQGAMLFRLVSAAAIAGAISTVWPSLRYAAVTAAIVTLNHDPELGGALEIAFAVMVGSVVGAVAAFVAWPDFGRRRTARTLRLALEDCRELLELAVDEVDGNGRRERDAVHARFLGNLETARSQAAETWFRPRLPSGVRLSDALQASENLWHGLVILDRALSDGRGQIGADALHRLRPAIRDVQRSACGFLDDASAALQDGQREPPSPEALQKEVETARQAAQQIGEDGDPQQGTERSKGLHALVFAFDEVERSLVKIAALVVPVGEARSG